MRYLVMPGKRADPADESGKKKIEYLTATVWPEPWSLEHTADEKKQSKEFEGSQAGLEAALEWLRETYRTQPEKWTDLPTILDCQPDR
jgi:hypothetical protein